MTVTRSGDRWTDGEDGLRAVTRPDGRCLLFIGAAPDRLGPLLAAAVADRPGDLYTMVDAADAATLDVLAAAGFTELRREGIYDIPIPAAATTPVTATGHELLSAADADLTRLRLLDQALREDIPGSAGWRWTPEAFRAASVDDPEFDPRTYLVAAAADTGDYVGLVRVWIRRDGPRLGCLAVLPGVRRTRVTAALLHAVLTELAGRGDRTMVAEVTDTNRPARALLERAGAVRTATFLELRRPARPDRPDKPDQPAGPDRPDQPAGPA